MNKAKVILGILVTIAGGIIMVTSMIFAIIHFAGSLHEDIPAIPGAKQRNYLKL